MDRKNLIGELIKSQLQEQGKTAAWLAIAIRYYEDNVSRLLSSNDMNTVRVEQISDIFHINLFCLMADQYDMLIAANPDKTQNHVFNVRRVARLKGKKLHVGQLFKTLLLAEGFVAKRLAVKIPYDPKHVYRLYSRAGMTCEFILQISDAMGINLFRYLAYLYGVINETAIT